MEVMYGISTFTFVVLHNLNIYIILIKPIMPFIFVCGQFTIANTDLTVDNFCTNRTKSVHKN